MYVCGLLDLQMLWSGSLLNVNQHLAAIKLDYMLPTGQCIIVPGDGLWAAMWLHLVVPQL